MNGLVESTANTGVRGCPGAHDLTYALVGDLPDGDCADRGRDPPTARGCAGIVRKDITAAEQGRPVISKAVVRGDTVYLCGVTPEPGGDVRSQTKQVLERIDRLLASAGTDKSNLLTAQVWLADMADFEAHNAVWNEWVDARNPPVRACVGAPLWRPGLRVEIMVTAARGMQ